MNAIAPVRVERRFARSARVDSDIGRPEAIEGYVLQPSVRAAFSAMAHAIETSGQGAFSWTGPYGGGKSSAALILAALLGPKGKSRNAAEALVDADTLGKLRVGFGPTRKGWKVVGLSGRRASIADDLRGALALSDNSDLVDAITADARSPNVDGLLVVVDELGKYLEHAAQDGGDLHILQDLAEQASRSKGRLVLLGILHQSFERYAARLPRATRDEWAKIQGRFQDIPLVTAVDETLDLISRAITCGGVPAAATALASRIADEVRQRRGGTDAALTSVLEGCWPLHPVVALLLGPLSRQRFGQNERSVFSFLSSAEPSGFQEFLSRRNPDQAYGPASLFDYLSANLGPAILASSDGHRFSTSLDAIDRAAARGGALHVALAKVATVIEMFSAGTGLAATAATLSASLPNATEREILAALEDLVGWSVLVHRKHLGAYAVFSGSDFDLDAAVAALRATDERMDLAERLALPPVVAKRHYHRTGCLRWSDVIIYPLPAFDLGAAADDARAFAASHAEAFDAWRGNRRNGAAIVLAVRPSGMTDRQAELAAKAIARRDDNHCLTCGLPRSSYLIRELALELDSLERIAQHNPQLEGDLIARREVQARISEVSSMLEQEIRGAFVHAKWFAAGKRATAYDTRPLSAIASAEADALFAAAPLIRNELINREKPSSNAMAAVRALLHAMAHHADKPRLGLTGFPPEFALYASVLHAAGVHVEASGGAWELAAPGSDEVGASYAALWQVAESLPDGSSIIDLYKKWERAPIGLRAGPMPILAFAWLLANGRSRAVYLDGVFTPSIDDFLADRLLQSPEAITVRHIALGHEHDALLNGLASQLTSRGFTGEVTPLTIARTLVRVVATLPKWTQRSRSFGIETRRIRDLILHADDPNKLLFDEIAALGATPAACVELVGTALDELERGYNGMLDSLANSLALSLGCDPHRFAGVGHRVAATQGIAGDLRLDAFAQRVGSLENPADRQAALEGLASFLVHRPAAQWSDQDVDKAHAEMIRFTRRLREAEALAVARGRAAGAEALSIVRASQGGEPSVHSFEVSADEARLAAGLADSMLVTMTASDHRVQLAALAEVLRRLENADAGREEAA